MNHWRFRAAFDSNRGQELQPELQGVAGIHRVATVEIESESRLKERELEGEEISGVHGAVAGGVRFG